MAILEYEFAAIMYVCMYIYIIRYIFPVARKAHSLKRTGIENGKNIKLPIAACLDSRMPKLS